MKKVILGMAVSSAMILASNVYAGPYVVASVGQTQIESDMSIGAFSLPSAKDTDTYVSVGFGYSMNKNFSVEVAYNDFGEGSDAISVDESGAPVDLDTEVSSFSVAAQGSLLLGEGFSVLGRVGVERWDVDFGLSANGFRDSGDDSGFDLFYGVGVSYALNDSLSIVAMYDVHKIDASDSFLIIGGIKADFDVDLEVFSLGAQLAF